MKEIDWKNVCKGCGLCCGPVPFKKTVWEKFQNRVQIPPQQVLKDVFPGAILPITESGKCVFLTPDKRCAIYESRPNVCRLYGTIPALQCKVLKQGLLAVLL
jgi:Fe-S-cluster containining protein